MGLSCVPMVLIRGMSELAVTEVIRTVVVGVFISAIRQITVICAGWPGRGGDGTIAALSIRSRMDCRSRMMVLVVGTRRVIFIDG